MLWRRFLTWHQSGELLAALRTLFTYTERSPDRATGWLYLPDGPPVTPWPPVLAETGPALLEALRRDTDVTFTACAFQAYLNGSGCEWHHDRDWGAQAILSLGVTRSFGLRGPGGAEFLPLAHGDLLFMPPGFQDEWEHCVPAESVQGERCSLVFRSPTPEGVTGASQRSLRGIFRFAVDQRNDR